MIYSIAYSNADHYYACAHIHLYVCITYLFMYYNIHTCISYNIRVYVEREKKNINLFVIASRTYPFVIRLTPPALRSCNHDIEFSRKEDIPENSLFPLPVLSDSKLSISLNYMGTFPIVNEHYNILYREKKKDERKNLIIISG